jgi:amidohydrolase
MTMPVINSVAAMKEEIAALRQELHQNPQTAFEETFASDLVARQLSSWNIEFERNWAGTGIIATIHGKKNTSGKVIGLRADMDALDIEEKSGVPYASQNPGKMHACGHDGHTSILLGAAKYLSENNNFDGKIHLIFQPAEEVGMGALKMIEEGLFDKYPMDAVYGLHNWPSMPVGIIGTRKGPLMASCDSLGIKITGKGGHAAMPQTTNDPVIIAAQIITALQTIVSRNVDPVEQAVISITYVRAGEGAFNVIGDSAELRGTIRAFTNEVRKLCHDRIEQICTNIGAAFNAEVEVKIFDGNDPTVNTANEVDLALKAAVAVVGPDKVLSEVPLVMGAEDFGAYTSRKNGCFIFIGQGVEDANSPHNQGLHNPHYNFNDEIIPVGVSYFAKLVETYMPLND